MSVDMKIFGYLGQREDHQKNAGIREGPPNCFRREGGIVWLLV